MATIKSYTDLDQSKKLAEILPIESADMQWIIDDIGEPFPFPVNDKVNKNEEPCWSLSALLEQFPYELCDEDGNSLYLQICKEYDDEYHLEYTDPNGDFESIETDWYEHFVDACYEMILKLHETKML